MPGMDSVGCWGDNGIMSRAKKMGLGLLLAGVLAVGLGTLALPGILQSQAERLVAEHYHRRLVLQKISINPLTGSLTVTGARLLEPDGRTVLAAFDALDIRLSISSLWHGAPVIRALRLVRPDLHLVLVSPHHYNVDDLLSPAEVAPSGPPGPLPHFSLHNVEVEEGTLRFENLVRHESHQVTALQLHVPMISTLADEEQEPVEPVLQAKVDGSDVSFRAHGLPFARQPSMQAHVDVEGVELTRYLEYLPVSLPVMLAAGRMGLHLDAAMDFPPAQGVTLLLEGQVQWKDLQGRTTGNPALKFGVDEAHLDLHRVGWSLHDQTLRWDRLTMVVSAARIEDTSLRRPVVARLSALTLALGQGDLGSATAVPTDFAATVNGGQLQVSGQTVLSPLQGHWQVNIARLDLQPLQSLLGQRLNLLFARGAVAAQGEVTLGNSPQHGMTGAYQGKLSVVDLEAVDPLRGESLLRWKSLYLNGIRLHTSPFSLAVQAVSLTDFFARVAVNADGQINLQQLVRTSPAGTLPPASAAQAVPPATGPPNVTIGKVVLQGGTVQFSDHFVQPHYSARLERLGGVISGLSSEEASMARLDLRGQVNQAPLEISGTLNPLRGNLFLDVEARVNGMEMAPFSPYAGKYMGYDIREGKLSFDVHYHVLDHVLTARNHLILDQLTFGNRVESQEATHLPVKLAIALLKDRNGVIDIHLPIEGSIDDPQFSVGGIILKMVLNLVVKAVESPFTLLGSFFEGHATPSWIAFEPGRADIPPDDEATLHSFAHMLHERPGLEVEITGNADATADAEGLRRARIDRNVHDLWVKTALEHGQSLAGSAQVPAQAYPDLLRQVYAQASFPKPRNLLGLEKSLPVPEMEKLLLANMPVTADDLARLALQRAQSAQAWLVASGQVPQQRLFIMQEPIQVRAGETPSRVQFRLK